jgi:hypothetical protein
MFDTAKFFSHDASDERLTHTDPLEAIEAHFAGWETDLEAYLIQHAPLTIYAFNEKPITPAVIRSLALDLVDRLTQALSDEYGGDETCFTKNDEEQIYALLLPAVEQASSLCSVWQCAQVAEKSYSVDELREILL